MACELFDFCGWFANTDICTRCDVVNAILKLVDSLCDIRESIATSYNSTLDSYVHLNHAYIILSAWTLMDILLYRYHFDPVMCRKADYRTW